MNQKRRSLRCLDREWNTNHKSPESRGFFARERIVAQIRYISYTTNPMKTLIKAFVWLIVLVAVGAVLLYVGYNLTKKENTIPVGAIPSDIATSTDATNTPIFTPSTVDTTSWNTYSSDELGYSVKYPANMLMNGADALISFSFAKESYFHWPLQDDAKITIVATSSCPALTVDGGDMGTTTSSFTLNGYTFTRREAHDAAAGNLYNEISYDTMANSVCYHIDFFDHGANGAGLYVGDPSLIAQYDAQHTADLKAVMDIFNAMTQTFHIR